MAAGDNSWQVIINDGGSGSYNNSIFETYTPPLWSNSAVLVPRVHLTVELVGGTDEYVQANWKLTYAFDGEGTVAHKQNVLLFASVTSDDMDNETLCNGESFQIASMKNVYEATGYPYILSTKYLSEDKGGAAGNLGIDFDFGFDFDDEEDTFLIASGECKFARKSMDRLVSVKATINWGPGGGPLIYDNKAGFRTTSPPKSVIQTRPIPIAALPEEAKKPAEEVTPGTGVGKWTAEWSPWKELNLDEKTPTSKPPRPTISIDGTELTITLDKGSVFDSNFRVVVEFQVVRNDTEIVYNTNNAAIDVRPILTNNLSTTLEITLGGKYAARCRTVKWANGTPHVSVWSDWSETKSAAPLRPEGVTCIAASSNGSLVDSIRVKWTPSLTAEAYKVQYVAPLPNGELSVEEMFNDAESRKEEAINDNTPECLLTELESGRTYYVRVCALSEGGNESDWSDIVSVVLGSVPAAPTTWSSRSTISAGESVTLYWVHNSMDGSSESRAKLTIYVERDGDTYLYPAEYVYKTTKFTSGMEVHEGRYYTNGIDKYLCHQNGSPTTLEDTDYFTKIDGGYNENEVSFYVLNTGEHRVFRGHFYSYNNKIYVCTLDGSPESVADKEYFFEIML